MPAKDDALIRAITPFFRRNYAPQHSFADAVAMLHMFPGLVGLWPCSAVGASGQLMDIGGNSLALTNNNTVLFNAAATSLIPWAEFASGSSEYFSLADTAILDITGSETHITGAIRGLTLGGWFYFTTNPASSFGLMSKNVPTGNQRAYTLFRHSSLFVRMQVSGDGSAAVAADSVSTVSAGTWYFVAGRFDPSTELAVWLNDEKTINTTSIPASLFNSSAAFEIGRTDSGNYLNGRSSLCFLCAAAVPDIFVNTFYDWTRPLFGR